MNILNARAGRGPMFLCFLCITNVSVGGGRGTPGFNIFHNIVFVNLRKKKLKKELCYHVFIMLLLDHSKLRMPKAKFLNLIKIFVKKKFFGAKVVCKRYIPLNNFLKRKQ